MLRPSWSFETTHSGRATPSCRALHRNVRESSLPKEARNPDDAASSNNFRTRSDDTHDKRCRRPNRALRTCPIRRVLHRSRLANLLTRFDAAARASQPKNTATHQQTKKPPREPTPEPNLDTSVPLALTSFSPAHHKTCYQKRFQPHRATCTNRHPTHLKLLSCPTFHWTKPPRHC